MVSCHLIDHNYHAIEVKADTNGATLKSGPSEVIDNYTPQINVEAVTKILDTLALAGHLIEEPAEAGYTQRGFQGYAPIATIDGFELVVRQSSLATDNCVWLFLYGPAEKRPLEQDEIRLDAAGCRALMACLLAWLASFEE